MPEKLNDDENCGRGFTRDVVETYEREGKKYYMLDGKEHLWDETNERITELKEGDKTGAPYDKFTVEPI